MRRRLADNLSAPELGGRHPCADEIAPPRSIHDTATLSGGYRRSATSRHGACDPGVSVAWNPGVSLAHVSVGGGTAASRTTGPTTPTPERRRGEEPPAAPVSAATVSVDATRWPSRYPAGPRDPARAEHSSRLRQPGANATARCNDHPATSRGSRQTPCGSVPRRERGSHVRGAGHHGGRGTAAGLLRGRVAGRVHCRQQGSTRAFATDPDYVAALAELFPETMPAPIRRQFGVAKQARRFDTVLLGRRTHQLALGDC